MYKTIKILFILAGVLVLLLLRLLIPLGLLNGKYYGADYQIFKGSPIWELAKAASRGDTAKIVSLVKEKGLPVDYVNPEYGVTVLMQAVYHNKPETVETLLRLGADPNHLESYMGQIKGYGRTPVIMASDYSWIDPDILELLLEYGGDPNSTERGNDIYDGKPYPMRASALQRASSKSIEKVKILLKYGADINYRDSLYNETAIRYTFFSHMNILYYLLQQGATPEGSMHTFYNDSADIIYCLRSSIIPLSDSQYVYKRKVIKLLEERGYDYWNAPIPEKVLGRIRTIYPDSADFEYYIKRY